jgi:menaquinone-specific isochorismate synthase
VRFVTRPIAPLADPLSRDPDTVWMSEQVSLWGWGEAARIQPGAGAVRFDTARQRFAELAASALVDNTAAGPGTGPVAFSSFTFADDASGSMMVVPRVIVGQRGPDWWMTTADDAGLPAPLTPPAETDRARYAGSSVPEVLWLEAVAEAVRRIIAGDLDKVVMARDYAVWSRQPFHLPRLLRHLADRFPTCHVFRVAGLVGASPELLVRRMGRRLQSVVLAGSAPVSDDPEVDARSRIGLLGSAKDQWEHRLAVSSVTERLAPRSDAIDVAPEPSILRLDNVQHLATEIHAQLTGGDDALALARTLHPTAAVGGTPTAEAVSLIRQLEGMDRGRYAGPVGWMDTSGDGEFAIALRCAELSGARARLFAGAGIVSDSLPEAELAETRLKLQAMRGALDAS